MLIVVVYTYFNLATAKEPGYAHTTNILGALNGANSGGVCIELYISVITYTKQSFVGISRMHRQCVGSR